MEVSMKSKLFLSLSILTAVFSVNATELSTLVKSSTGQFVPGAQTIGQSTKFCADFSTYAKHVNYALNMKAAKAALPLVGLVGTTAAVTAGIGYSERQTNLAKQAELAKQSELANRPWYTKAKDGIISGYNTATTKASELYNQATLENMKNGVVNGYKAASKFAMENKAITAGAVVGTAAVVYGAYKLYNSDMFAKSKKQTVPAVKAPVAKPVVKPVVKKARPAYMGA
jgi:hypothetical protein